ncbi:MAG: MFS transporter [Deltaproteobacteria bacterium]|nr:MFS transporter [Deltaproteobacteria bacterium]
MTFPLVLLMTLSFLVSVDVRILAPILPSISASLSSSPGSIGLAMTTYSFAYGLGQLVYGPLSDRLSRIAVVRTAGVAFALFTVLSALSVTTWQFIGVRLLAGSFAGAVIPLTLVYIGDTFEYERRQVVLGRLSALTSAAMAFSAAIGGAVAHFVSWRWMLVGYGLLAMVPVGLMWRLGAEKKEKPAASAESYGMFLRDRRALFVYAGVLLEGFLMWGAVTYLGSFGERRYGLDQFTVGLLLAFFGVGTVTGGLLMGRIRRFLSENLLAGLGGLFMGSSFLVLIPGGRPILFACGMFTLGLGFVGLHTTLQLRGTEISETARGKAFSLFTFSLFSGVSLGSAAFGRLVDGGHYGAMFTIAGIGLIAIGLATAFAPQCRTGRWGWDEARMRDFCPLE